MNRLVHAELLKLRTTRMLYLNALAALAFVPISVATSILTAGNAGAGAALNTSEGLRNVMAAASSGSIIALVIGILVMSGEFRHSTATSTFLISPRRAPVLRAKLMASALLGAVLAIGASGLTLAVALPWLAVRNIEVDVFSRDIWIVLLGGIAATSLYALVGVGVGALVRNQTAAVVLALVWVLVVEGLLVSFVPAIGKWLPGGAAAALSAAATAKGELLPIWGAALLFTGYGVAFAALATRALIRHDIN
jgi:ABC-2 type transport system permease protein